MSASFPRAANRLESAVANDVRRWARARGVTVIKLTTFARYGSAGWPDYLLLAPTGGRVAFVEVKARGGRLTDLQRAKIAGLIVSGFTAIVWRDGDDLSLAREALSVALGVDA